MKKTALLTLSIALLMMSGCTETKQASKEVVIYQHTTDEVYKQMCVNCHGKMGEGVKELDKNGKPKGPALNNKELYELKLAITDIKNGGLNQSSGSDHEIMNHNYKAIKKKGMDYDTDEMANYLVDNFQKK
jgi:mono/diheme cytochrome c family protein